MKDSTRIAVVLTAEAQANTEDIAYRVIATRLPELYAVVVRSASSPMASYRYRLFLLFTWTSKVLGCG